MTAARRRIPPSRPTARPADDGAALVLGPLFGTSATALAPLVSQGGANVVSFSNDEQAAQRGVWIMGIAAPPQVRRVVDHSRRCRHQALRRLRTADVLRPADGADHGEPGRDPRRQGGRGRAFDANSADLNTPARRLAEAARGEDKLAVLVPVAPPRLSAALAALAAAGIDNKSVQLIGTGVWDVPNIGSEVMLRGAWYAAPDPAKRADFERRFLSTYGRPPHRLATLAYDGVSLAGHLARLKQGGDFSEAAITNPNGWSGIDGIFRFLPNGRSERALAVIAVQAGPGMVVSPAPTSFACQAGELRWRADWLACLARSCSISTTR